MKPSPSIAALPPRRSAVEQLLDCVLDGREPGRDAPEGLADLIGKVFHFDGRETRVVILGGGTGMSTVVGGNSNTPDWADQPFTGLKRDFPRLQVVVCATDDGGSTGRLLRQLPMIGIGDLRKSCLSSIQRDLLQATYRLDNVQWPAILRLLQRVFTWRFGAAPATFADLRDPLRVAYASDRAACPAALAGGLRRLGRFLCPGGGGPVVDPAGHCLGNLLLTSAIFQAAGGPPWRTPNARAMRTGIDAVARLIGAPAGVLHAVTHSPGQLTFCYTNGVEVIGQSKASHTRRGFPIRWLRSDFAEEPRVAAPVLQALREADLIILAPGSLYTSTLPLLQIPAVGQAIRANRRALKVLGANFWVQEGETDISLHNQQGGFLVSELIEAYDHNVPGGAHGLFDVVLSSNLENLSGDILRNYALEGKRPIHLDRSRVEAMGFLPVEATLFSLDRLPLPRVIHHDPEQFALAIRTLLVADRHLATARLRALRRRRPGPRVAAPLPGRCAIPCLYLAAIRAALRRIRFQPASLRELLLDLAWENRDIRPQHFRHVKAVRTVPAPRWGRSVEWDNILGYYDPEDQTIKLHGDLLAQPASLRENLIIALGEAVLGRYIAGRQWEDVKHHGARCYSIHLLPASRRASGLDDRTLRRYLSLARLNPCRTHNETWCLTLNRGEGFLPPGLLFGLMYAWYLNNAWGGLMEYEMSLLRWPPESLIPHQVKERQRKQALVDFFRKDVFGHP